MLVFPLKKEWYEKIKNGEKTVEYRRVRLYWQNKFYNEIGLLPEQTQIIKPIPCKLFLPIKYMTKYMTATITKIEIVNGKDTDLHINRPVYAIHLTNVKEVMN